MTKNLLKQSPSGLSPIAMALAYTDWALHLASSPARQWDLARQAIALPAETAARLNAQKTADAQPLDAQDHRFDDPAWARWPFNAFKETFQATEAWWDQAAQIEGMSAHHTHMMRFYTRQMLDALSPSNWALSNPEVLKLGYATMGQSLRKGSQSLLKDLGKQWLTRLPGAHGVLAPLPYAVGQDVAVTPGKVVFRNSLIELIQYAPTTSTVAAEPLLIVPSCIMKYYILDLSPGNSMVRYLVDKGYTVFMVSWRNPDASDRDLGLEDYLQTGVMEAMAAVREATGAARIHTLGYCLGGTFLSIAAAALDRNGAVAVQNKRMPQLASVTLLAALTDFTEPGEMGIFIDAEQVKSLKAQMAETGYLSGRQMAGTFQFLNARDLIWSRNTRRYLLGEDETGNDMMSWNADVTRLPARMHSEYLEQLFLNNALAAGQFRFAGVGVALMDIKAPMLVVGTVRDHVCPWKSVYKVHLLTETDTTFILAAGGHNAGIVSEPGHPRRSYQMAHRKQGDGWTDPSQWQAKASRHEGSWWESLHRWLQTNSGKQVPARAIPPASSLCDAPGEYVMLRYAD
jgi:polyhydroxyalkanoate synthase